MVIDVQQNNSLSRKAMKAELLDAETEFQLHKDLEAFLRQRTTLIIAHRLSAVKQADRVYVFEDGFITEEGHHDELIARQGLYAQLYGDRQA